MPENKPNLPLDKNASSIQAMFADIAPRYDLLNHLLSMNVDRYWRWRTTHLVPPNPSGMHLDVCTGTGDLALAYHRAGKGALRVVATDFCAPMVKRGHEKAAGKLPFLVADTMRLPFPTNMLRDCAKWLESAAPAAPWLFWNSPHLRCGRCDLFTCGISAPFCP